MFTALRWRYRLRRRGDDGPSGLIQLVSVLITPGVVERRRLYRLQDRGAMVGLRVPEEQEREGWTSTATARAPTTNKHPRSRAVR
ncbi:hypothetical protein J4732_11480 [Serratia marcescens]|uniref:Uncharacterized protein n=1 Tax=Serratia marcescens TaxID=615 RepID=A0A939STG9_SERMA|nr:hypothetical protein [Serratia marcescens]